MKEHWVTITVAGGGRGGVRKRVKLEIEGKGELGKSSGELRKS